MIEDLAMETNHWIIEDPAWADYSKSICTREHHWTLYYGDNYFLRIGKESRFPVSWPNIAEHFYALQWMNRAFHWDTIFASYSLSEIKRFIDAMSWPLNYKTHMLRIRDEVLDECFSIADFIETIKIELHLK